MGRFRPKNYLEHLPAPTLDFNGSKFLQKEYERVSKQGAAAELPADVYVMMVAWLYSLCGFLSFVCATVNYRRHLKAVPVHRNGKRPLTKPKWPLNTRRAGKHRGQHH